MSDRVWQEFYCNDCDGYFRAKLNMALNNYGVLVVCPNCGRKHPRTINKGKIVDDYSRSGGEEILCPKSTYSKEPCHKKMKKHARNGEIIESNNDLISERWLEIHGG